MESLLCTLGLAKDPSDILSMNLSLLLRRAAGESCAGRSRGIEWERHRSFLDHAERPPPGGFVLTSKPEVMCWCIGVELGVGDKFSISSNNKSHKIRMVAGFAEVIEREATSVAAACNIPNVLIAPFRIVNWFRLPVRNSS
jgi:hypothetical protein